MPFREDYSAHQDEDLIIIKKRQHIDVRRTGKRMVPIYAIHTMSTATIASRNLSDTSLPKYDNSILLSFA